MLSQTVEYALRAMMHLAAIDPSIALSSQSLAERTHVPKGYLSKIMRSLVLAELVVSRRGPRGGFAIARATAAISIFDVVQAVDPIRRLRTCPLGNPLHVNLCPLHQSLDDAMATIEREFKSTSLAQLHSSSGNQTCRALTRITIDELI